MRDGQQPSPETTTFLYCQTAVHAAHASSQMLARTRVIAVREPDNVEGDTTFL
jgi:hypothetical protein